MTLILLFLVLVTAKEVLYNFRICEFDVAPDGFTRPIVGVNGQFPGPTIYATEGDTLKVNVTNELDYPTTIHWHGIIQTGTPYMDGTNAFTQCPIPPGASLTYAFLLQQSGTYWWHAHRTGQYVDGMRGALIIAPQSEDDCSEREEFILQFSDWYHEWTADLLKTYLSPASQGNEPIPDSGLINNAGTYNCSLAPSSTSCESNRSIEQQHATFVVSRNKTYRFRLLNTGAFAMFTISIDQHWMTIVEVDGTLVQPLTVNQLTLNVAQRYVIEVNMSQHSGQFWIRGDISTDCLPTDAPDLDTKIYGILRYNNTVGQLALPTSVGVDSSACVELQQMNLHPLNAQPAPSPVNHSLQIDVVFQPNNQGINLAYINNSTFVMPADNYSILLQAKAGDSLPSSLNPFVLDVEPDAVIELTLNNFDTGEHPFHLHGHRLVVVGQGQAQDGPYNSTNTSFVLHNKPHDNPLIRDVVTVPANSWIVVRWIANSPGTWAFHCHINWHLEAGLAFVIVERPRDIRSLSIPSLFSNMCHFYDYHQKWNMTHTQIPVANRQLGTCKPNWHQSSWDQYH